MPAKSKDELLQSTLKEFTKLDGVVSGIQEDVALKKDDEDTSIKDVIGHRAHWIELFLGWYRDGVAGKNVDFPSKGYKWNELKRYNANLRANQKDLTWHAAVNLLHSNHSRLVDFIRSRSNDELYGGPMPGAKSHWTTGRWAEAAGPSHYRSAIKYLRQRVRSLS